MEKLILRSVMYGADKIPDIWFEKVPGGFYKTKDGKTHPNSDKKDKRDSTGSRPSTSDSRSTGRSRRHSTGDGLRDQQPGNDHGDDGYRSVGQRRRRDRDRQRESYDGMEEDDYYSGDDRRRRRNHGSSRRRRSFEDDHGYNHGTGLPPPRDDRRDERRMNDGAPYPERAFGAASRQNPGQYAPAMCAAAAGAANGAAAATYPPSNSVSPSLQSAQPAPNGRGGIAGGYVPYANIYGSPAPQSQSGLFSPPPQPSAGSVPPNETNRLGHPVAPPPGRYHQDPYAQGAAAAAAQSGYPTQDQGYDPRYDHRYDDRYIGYDETGRPYPLSPPPHHGRSRREDYSPSYDSYDSRAADDRRARPEHRPADDLKRSKSQGGGRGKSRRREHFDTSQRGLVYGAVGALAGGLVGSEISKGPLQMAIGAAVGALGANAFEARERYVPAEYSESSSATATSTMKTVDPRKPLGAQMREEMGGRPGPGRRREDERAQKFDEGSVSNGRRDERRASGYYSD